MRLDDQPAYVLHRRAFSESSQIVELLTRDHGRIAALA
ncbi:MAG: DNA repair protein RecO, partial [Myxococcaceae bacterium]